MLRLGEQANRRGLAAAIWSLVLLCAFAAARLTPGVAWIGGAFFTLRLLHVVGDWWMGRLAIPTIRAHLRYQLFLPVMFAGPIHRFETFDRQAERRRWDAPLFFAGLERALIGAFSAFVVAGWFINRIANVAKARTEDWDPFFHGWSQAAIEWISLYFVFAGFTAIALGFSLMIGLRLEENFDRPWAARNLIEFWTRWHMSLTRWCRDYVFRPVTAVTRSALAGLAMGMLAMGLWHEFSIYYLFWSFWQALGVVLTRLALRRIGFARVPLAIRAIAGPISVLGWLSLARPLFSLISRLFA